MLHPFAYSFYRRYGWKLATEAIRYRLKPADLSISSGQKRIRAYREGDLALMIMLVEGES